MCKLKESCEKWVGGRDTEAVKKNNGIVTNASALTFFSYEASEIL